MLENTFKSNLVPKKETQKRHLSLAKQAIIFNSQIEYP